MAGAAMVSFKDWVTATNERVVTGPDKIISDAVNNTYSVADMLRGRGVDEVVQSGSSLTDRIQLTSGTQFQFYGANDQFDVVIEDTLSKIKCNWRFAKDSWAWTDHEIELNEGDRFTQFKKLKSSKRQACFVSLYNGIENALWATPDSTAMESDTVIGGRPFSIRAFITEDGLAPAGFTTVMGLDPAVNPRWRNQVSSYVTGALDSTLIAAMEDMWLKLDFQSPDTKEQYFQETKWKKFKIYTSREGRVKYTQLTRQSNDDAMPDLGWAVQDPTFGNIPVRWVQPLDAVGYTTGQPRFFFCNFVYLYPIFHSKRYMWETDPIQGGSRQPFSWVVYKDTWYNLFCGSRWRQGIVVPG
jgi:hypothetical protein